MSKGFGGSDEIRSPKQNDYTGATIVKPVQCWEGAHGRLKRSQKEAAADIIGAATERDAAYLIDNDKPMPDVSAKLGEAILWAADHIRARAKRKPKGRGK